MNVDEARAALRKLRDEKLRDLEALQNQLIGFDMAIKIIAEIEDQDERDHAD